MKLECSICKKHFNNSRSLAGHIGSHTRSGSILGKRNKSYTSECSICLKTFTSKRKRITCSNECRHKATKLRHELYRNSKLIYNKTLSFIAEYREKQNTCEICGKEENVKIRNVKLKLALDHDHITNDFRGLLCFICNTRYEWFLENSKSIMSYHEKKLP